VRRLQRRRLGRLGSGGANLVEQQNPGLKRTIIRRTELPGGTYEVVQFLVEIEPNTAVERHTHPGIESTVVLEGAERR
jgi:quercetin dioxygenase-like cupin family protein